LRTLLPYLTKPDVRALRTQLTTLYADREREAVRDIRTAVDEWTSQRELVAIATRRVQLESDRVRELGVKREAGVAVETDYRLARLELFKAQADLIREAVKWQRADVKARQAMGLLCSGVGRDGVEVCGEDRHPRTSP
jgi:outer membrane protein TolC